MSWKSVELEDVETGERTWDLFPASEMPALGAEFVHEGRRMRRVLEAPRREGIDSTSYEFVGWQHPRLNKVKALGLVKAPRYDRKGRPVFRSRKEVTEYAARVNDNPAEGRQIQWER